MTACIGVKRGDTVYLASDSGIFKDKHIYHYHLETKIFDNGEFSFAFAGDIKVLNIFQKILNLNVKTTTGLNKIASRNIYKFLPEKIRYAIADCGYKNVSDLEFELIGVHRPSKTLFVIDNDLCIIEHDVATVGSGGDYVIGAYEGLIANNKKWNKKFLTQSLEIGGKFCNEIRAPFFFKEI